jgi:predicted nucleic acid-binding protein
LSAVTLDSSVWLPYLREERFAGAVDALIGDGRVWLHSVVLLELYAGTATVEEKRDVDAIRSAAQSLGRLFHPSEADFCLAGQLLSTYARRYGRVRPRDHSHDLLIAIGAARTGSLLLTANLNDMSRWAKLLRRLAGLRVRVAAPRRE